MASSRDIEAIKDVLLAQQQLLMKLYGELDEERELSSCAADEAMAMIVRLQAEKAKLKMEANEYRRESEEQMCEAEESLSILEDLIEQKEAEIAYLEFQVQFYRNKLVSMGYPDLAVPEQNENEESSDQKRKSVEMKKSSIPMVPKKGGGDMNEYWENMKKVKKMSNDSKRPARSCSEPPPEIELSPPIGV